MTSVSNPFNPKLQEPRGCVGNRTGDPLYNAAFIRATILTLFAALATPSLSAQAVPICPKCLNPRITSKTGVGTASAAFEAKVVLEDAQTWCAVNRPHDKYCATFEVRDGGDGARKSYSATANCSTGEMRAINGGDYKVAGVWPDGPGKGRVMIRRNTTEAGVPNWDSPERNGQSRGDWDRNGGYTLTNQWELLCGTAVSGKQTATAAPARLAPASSPEAAKAPVEKEWLSLCNRCDNPDVFAKSGIGTANAVAQARLPRGAKVYRATANCMTGRITTADEKTFTLAGVWDNSDIGGGRTKWRGADGQIEGRDNASNGLAISQQWEVLCPGPVSAALLGQTSSAAAQVARSATATPPAPSVSACAGKRFCDEVGTFAAIVTDFRPSNLDSSTRLVSATVRFLNKTNRPLILGYVRNAGVAIDEQGNRYTLPSPESVRGIAEITGGRDFDPKFTVQPGQTSDARFEFVWKWNGRDIIGQLAWDVDLTIREVNEIAPGQYRFGQEHALQFKGVPGRNAGGPAALGGVSPVPLTQAPAAAAAAAVQPPSAAAAPPPAEPDACAGRPRCYDAGPFVAEIVQGSLTREGTFQDRIVRLNVRFRNKTNAPIVLAYVARTSVLSNNLGNRFAWGTPGTYDTSATGIGKVEGNKADPQFVLGPGEARAATFTNYRKRPPRTEPDGSGYTWGVTIAQLEVLYNGQQIRTAREHTLTFPDFGLNGPGANATAAPGARPNPQSIKEATDSLRDIFKKKK